MEGAAERRPRASRERTGDEERYEGTNRGWLDALDRVSWGLFALAAAVAVVLLLWLGRGRSFGSDELTWFMQAPSLDLEGALEPHNGHLMLLGRPLEKALFETVGTTNYVPFTLLTVSMVVLAAGLFFAFAKRRVGGLVALAPTLILLVFGSDPSTVMAGIGFSVIGSVACGLGALLALDRGDRRGDAIACALLTLGIVMYSVGVAFVAGALVLVLLGTDRWRRLWVVAVPIAIYGAWWLWARSQSFGTGQEIALDDVLLFPAWVFQSLSAVLSALVGVDYAFGETTTEVGPALAVVALVALAWRLRRGAVPRMLWAALAIAGALWLSGSIASAGFRLPDSTRYLYIGAIVTLIVAASAASGRRWCWQDVVTVFVVAACGVAINVALLRDWGETHRQETLTGRAELAAIEIAGGEADPSFAPSDAPTPIAYAFGGIRRSGAYLAAVDHFGGVGFPVEELRGQSEDLRAEADRTLIGALSLGLGPADNVRRGGACGQLGVEGSSFELAAPGVVVLESDAAAAIRIRRFADVTSADLGTLTPGEPATVTVPADAVSDPWLVTATAPTSACPASPR